MEYIVPCLIFAVTALIMIAIGISNFKSDKPVGFYTGIEPPPPEEITDISAYNKKHGWMWIAYGIGIAACAILPFLTDSNIIITFVSCLFGVGGVLILMIGHAWLDKKYRTK